MRSVIPLAGHACRSIDTIPHGGDIVDGRPTKVLTQ